MFEYVKQFWRALVSSEPDRHSAFSDETCVARPVVNPAASQPFSWRNETVLFLGIEAGLMDLGRGLSSQGATVAFRSLERLQDIYQLPLEQYTMVILTSDWDSIKLDVTDIGGILRRADQSLILVWASEQFVLSHLADEDMRRFCDIALSLPASAKSLELFLNSGENTTSKPSILSLV